VHSISKYSSQRDKFWTLKRSDILTNRAEGRDTRYAQIEADAESCHILNESILLPLLRSRTVTAQHVKSRHVKSRLSIAGDKEENEGLAVVPRVRLAFQQSIFGRWQIWSGNSFSGWWASRHEQYAANLRYALTTIDEGKCVRCMRVAFRHLKLQKRTKLHREEYRRLISQQEERATFAYSSIFSENRVVISRHFCILLLYCSRVWSSLHFTSLHCAIVRINGLAREKAVEGGTFNPPLAFLQSDLSCYLNLLSYTSVLPYAF